MGAKAGFLGLLTAGMLLAACGSDDGRAGSETPTSAPGTSTPATTTPGTTTPGTTARPPSSASSLTGSWVADANQILAANTSNVGGTGLGGCQGPITMTFNNNGTFTRDAPSIRCGTVPIEATGWFNSAGSYTVQGNRINVTVAQTEGSMTIGPRTVGFGDQFSGDMTYDFENGGNVLVLHLAQYPVGNVDHKYVRSA